MNVLRSLKVSAETARLSMGEAIAVRQVARRENALRNMFETWTVESSWDACSVVFLRSFYSLALSIASGLGTKYLPAIQLTICGTRTVTAKYNKRLVDPEPVFLEACVA
jgi:hypothetical protein